MNQRVVSGKIWVLLPLLFLTLFSCRKEIWKSSPPIEKEFNLTGFNKISVTDNFTITLTKGAAFSVKAIGPVNDVNDIVFSIANNILDIQYDDYINNRPGVNLVITVPTLVSLNLAGASEAVINGFQDEPHVIRAVLSGASKCTLNGTGINTNIDISGGSSLTVNGITANLYGNISGGGKLHAYGLLSDEVDIDASGGAVAYVKVSNTLFAAASGGSRIYYKGTPAIKQIETSGGGQVIQE